MEDIALTSIALLLIVIGIIGSFLPILPATPLAWAGLVIFFFCEYCDFGWITLLITGIIMLLMVVFEYLIPIIGTRKMGGSKYGTFGSIIGLLVGLFFIPIPFGFVVGTFVGAFVGELIKNKDNVNGAFKAALGSFGGFLLSTGLNIILCCVFLGIIIYNVVN